MSVSIEKQYKKKGKLFNDKILMVNIQFIQNGRNLIELVKPYKNNKGILKYLSRKNYAYHFAYKVINLENSIGNIYLPGISNIFLKKKIGKDKFSTHNAMTPLLAFDNNDL